MNRVDLFVVGLEGVCAKLAFYDREVYVGVGGFIFFGNRKNRRFDFFASMLGDIFGEIDDGNFLIVETLKKEKGETDDDDNQGKAEDDNEAFFGEIKIIK